MKRTVAVLACLSALVLIASSCGDSKADSPDRTAAPDTCRKAPDGAKYATIKVPSQCATIQEAVTASAKGDLVLIDAGVYKEEVKVETPDITIRGVDRNKVIIDGEFTRDNGIMVLSNGVTVENLTVRNNKSNGVFFTGSYAADDGGKVLKNDVLVGYRASYVTAYNNGRYGIYAFNAEKGQFDNSLGSGHPDSAFYVGQCLKCEALLTDVVSEKNMLGYSGTNSTGVVIVNSIFRNNRVGIVPNSEHGEAHAPNAATTIIGNLIQDNNSGEAPLEDKYKIGFGSGVVLGGVQNNIVERNRIDNQKVAGIVVTDQPEKFMPANNIVRDNVITKSAVGIAMAIFDNAPKLNGNCFEGNKFDTEYPTGLQAEAKCGGPDVDLGPLAGVAKYLVENPPNADWKTVAAPPDQPNMPDVTAAPTPARGPKMPDLDAIKVPPAS